MVCNSLLSSLGMVSVVYYCSFGLCFSGLADWKSGFHFSGLVGGSPWSPGKRRGGDSASSGLFQGHSTATTCAICVRQMCPRLPTKCQLSLLPLQMAALSSACAALSCLTTWKQMRRCRSASLTCRQVRSAAGLAEGPLCMLHIRCNSQAAALVTCACLAEYVPLLTVMGWLTERVDALGTAAGGPVATTHTGWSWKLLDTTQTWNYRTGAHAQVSPCLSSWLLQWRLMFMCCELWLRVRLLSLSPVYFRMCSGLGLAPTSCCTMTAAASTSSSRAEAALPPRTPCAQLSSALSSAGACGCCRAPYTLPRLMAARASQVIGTKYPAAYPINCFTLLDPVTQLALSTHLHPECLVCRPPALLPESISFCSCF